MRVRLEGADVFLIDWENYRIGDIVEVNGSRYRITERVITTSRDYYGRYAAVSITFKTEKL